MKQFIIIGNSAAGIAGVEAIRKKDKDSKIIVICDEDYPAYCRYLLSYYLAGQVQEEKLFYRGQDFYKENNIELLLNKKVIRVDPKKNRVVLEDKTQYSYDRLLIATGASPKFPSLPGIKKKGVFGLRTIRDAREISGLLPVAKTACILGGSLIGLKAAYALKKRNLEVKVVIKSQQVLSQMLDSQAAAMVQKKLEDNGIEVILGQDAQEIIGNGNIQAVKLDSGKVFACSLVVVGEGVEPNIDLVKDSGIKINQGIIANKLMQTNLPDIYTAGDVCEGFDLTLNGNSLNALWPIAVEQGRIAGGNMAGESISYDGSLGMNSLEFFGLPVISLGIYKAPAETGYSELKMQDLKNNLYKKFILKDNLLLGGILVGEIKNSGVFLSLIREKVNISSFADKLLKENFSYLQILDFLKEKEQRYV